MLMTGVRVTHNFLTELEKSVSQARLTRYRQNAASDLEVATRYLWNMALCESLYPCLNALEVGLRNSIHHAAATGYLEEYWFDLPGMLLKKQPIQLQRARSSLIKQGKPSPHTAGQIIAELNFGFWTTLLSDPYHSAFWMSNRANLLKLTFPHMKNAQRIRGEIHSQLDTIRLLRNRVFHFEPIWQGLPIAFNEPFTMKDLPDLHSDALEAIGWMNPTMLTSILILDRFDDTFRRGLKTVEIELLRRFDL